MNIMRPQTKEEYNERQRRNKLYRYYGIPYGVFDETDIPTHIERDWSKAISLISQHKEIPKELEDRLLRYKRQKELNNKDKRR